MLPMVWSSLLMVNIAALGTYKKVSKLSKIKKKINMNKLKTLVSCSLVIFFSPS